jgi:transcriptional regulator with XRE-family HTH domain
MIKTKQLKVKTLNELIKSKGYDIKQFCKACGFSVSLFYDIRSGKVDPTVEKICAMCRTLSISFKELLTYLGKDVTGIPNDE